MGVTFAEVSPDICFRFNPRCYCGAFSIAARGLCYCHIGRLYARRVGVGAIKRFHLNDAARVAGGALRPAVGADALHVARIPLRCSSTDG